jgi:hypothetical protein
MNTKKSDQKRNSTLEFKDNDYVIKTTPRRISSTIAVSQFVPKIAATSRKHSNKTESDEKKIGVHSISNPNQSAKPLINWLKSNQINQFNYSVARQIYLVIIFLNKYI